MLGDDDHDDEASSPTSGPSRAAAPGSIFISDNASHALMSLEPKTPTRRPMKRAFQDEDEDEDEEDTIIFATPPPLSQQRQQQQQQLPTPLSPFGGVDPVSMVMGAGPSTPSPSAAHKKRRARRRQPSSPVKQETDPVGGMVMAYDDSRLGLGTGQGENDEVKPSFGKPLQEAVASGSGSAAGPAQALPKFEGLAWLSPCSEDATVVVGGGFTAQQDARGFEGGVKKEEQEEQTLRRNDGRPARRGTKRDYSIYA